MKADIGRWNTRHRSSESKVNECTAKASAIQAANEWLLQEEEAVRKEEEERKKSVEAEAEKKPTVDKETS